MKVHYIIFLLSCSSLIFIGCATIIQSELDDAIPQGKNILSVGVGAAVPIGEQVNTEAKNKGIVVEDKHSDLSGKLNVKFGLNENTDLNAAFWYATNPGYGFRIGMKKSVSISPDLKIAFLGSTQYFFTSNEIPYWEYVQTTYNRKILGLTVGGVASYILAKRNDSPLETFNSISLGTKFSMNYANIYKEFSNIQYDYFDPFTNFEPQLITSYFFAVTPYIVLSSRSPNQTFYLEILSPFVNYDNFKSTSVRYWQISVGVVFKIYNFDTE